MGKSIFAKRLKELRGSGKQAVIARGIGLSPQTIGRYENDNREPKISELIMIADYYGVSVDYLLGRTEVKPTPTDGKLQAASEITGLSEISVRFLENTQKYNAETWHLDVINGFLESEHFKKIIYYLTESITRNNHDVEYDAFKTTTSEMAETIVTKEFHLLIDELREKFKDRIEHDDRVWYMALSNLYADGKITNLQYEQTKAEFHKDNYSYNPLDGGADHGKHNPSKE